MTKANTRITIPEELRNAFLSHYFFMDALFGAFMTEQDKYTAYMDMAEIFCLSDDARLEDFYTVIQSDLFSQAHTYDDFCYLSRTMQLMPHSFTPDEQYILAQKSTGFARYRRIFNNAYFPTQSAGLHALEQAAKQGNTYASALLAFFSYTGICLPLSEGRAMHQAKKLSRWNDMFGILMWLHYTDVNADKQSPEESQRITEYLLSMLVASLGNASEQEMLTYLTGYYGYAVMTDEEDAKEDVDRELPAITPHKLSKALASVLDGRTLSEDTMHPALLKVLRSPVLSDLAKQNIILSYREGQPLDVLPLNIRRVSQLAPVTSWETHEPISRPEEQRKLLANLSTIDARRHHAYRPLLLVCRDPYVLESYTRMLEQVIQTSTAQTIATAHIDLGVPSHLSLLTGQDKSMSHLLDKLKDACPVLFLKNCQALEESHAEVLTRFLQVDLRRQFPTPYDDITLDLSGILPILLATSMPDKSLCRMCDVVNLKAVSPEEMSMVLAQLLQTKCQLYGLEALDAEPCVFDKLCGMSPSEASALLDKAIACSRMSHAQVCHEASCGHASQPLHLTSAVLDEAEKLHFHPSMTRLI